MKFIVTLLLLLSACGGSTSTPPVEPAADASTSSSSSSSSSTSGTATTPACTVATDCTGAHSNICKECPDGTQACAHWTCASGACAIAYCE